MIGIRKVVFITANFAGTRRYRVNHQAEQLQLKGVSVQILDTQQQMLAATFGPADAIILHRIGYSPLVQRVLSEARRYGAAVLLDVDDLIFEPALAPLVGGYPRLDRDQQQHFTHRLEGVRETMRRVDGVIAATERLAQHCRQHNKRVIVNRNALNRAIISISEAQTRIAAKHSGCVLGYFSGSPTHDADFQSIAGVLNTVLEQYPQTTLWVAGHINLPDHLMHRDRVRRVASVPWTELPGLIRQVDINLAPLELKNPFCHCKSELKYIEAGILQVPTIASRTAGFAEAVADGQTGFLAGNEHEWTAKLSMLVRDPELRRRIGANACRHVRQEYTPQRRGEQFVQKLGGLLTELKRSRPGAVYNVSQSVRGGVAGQLVRGKIH